MPGLTESGRWEVLPPDPAAELSLSRGLDVAPIVARVLAVRGIRDVDEAREFLAPSLARDWADPLLIPGMGEAADRVGEAVDKGEVIAVFGDFDVDGMTSTCLLTRALRRMGAEVHPFIPHRFGEGYGISREAMRRVFDSCTPDLVVTVDNGIAAAAEVAELVSGGVDVVVTDHHEPADLVPQGVPVTDPKLSADCPSRELAGAGVALKLVAELGRRRGMPDLWRDYIDLAMMGTLSDMMLLSGENRSLVAEGLELLRRAPRPGIAALAQTAGVDLAALTADSLPFSLIPRLNSAGRMGTTDVAFDLLMCDDAREAALLATRLEEINTERRAIEARLSEDAMAKIEATWTGGRSIVVGGEGWHEGVKGIVASRIVNRYHVPAILFSIQDGVARGSGRSVGSVDLFRAVEQCADCLVRFGGHSGAVGVTCESDRLPEFARRLDEVLSALPQEQFADKGEVTAIVGLEELSVESIAALEALQPFGQGNKKPLFACRGVSMRNRARVGADESHLRFFATDGVSSLPAIMFRVPGVEHLVDCDGAVDLVFEAVNETWAGRTKAKLMVKDILERDAAQADDPALMGVEPSPLPAALAQAEGTPAENLDEQEAPSALDSLAGAELDRELTRRLIGNNPLLPAQAAALERLAAGRSTLCVMATGRGKSLIFQLHAARSAILEGTASVFVYPLRALVADQAFHLRESLSGLGLAARILTGETPAEEREDVFCGLADGTVDVVLTTPEFLVIHSNRFAEGGRVGFVAIDECHHAGLSRAGHRSAYSELPRVREELGQPVCLAVSATVSDDAAVETCRLLGIDQADVVVDDASRENLRVRDLRNLHDRDTALVNIVAAGESCIVYVTSRDQSIEVVRMLRHRIPELARRISYYNAGLSRDVRARVEQAFRAGDVTCIVSTSAFGEGVNLPHVRSVVLYALPFGRVEFNQMSGRAGRDGADSTVALMFGARDLRLSRKILSSAAPERSELVSLYRTLVSLDRAAGAAGIAQSDADIAAAATRADAAHPLDAAEVASGVRVFEELGFLSIAGWGDSRRIRMTPSPARMDLEASARYLEGLQGRDEFGEFSDWVLHCPCEELQAHVARPMAPTFGTVVGEG